ncbi:MAG: PAS domain S-box protein [Proteobacteria bacterium]|nr:PAS domain S-box protein [Pseudomonadota bacterium]
MARSQQAGLPRVSEACALVLVGSGPLIESVAAVLAATDWSVATASEPRALAEVIGDRASIVLLDETQLAAVRRHLRGRSSKAAPALLLLVDRRVEATRRLPAAARLEEVLYWPSEPELLDWRLRALGEALLAERSAAALAQRLALLAAIAAAARSDEGFQEGIHRPLVQLAACTGARCARVLVPAREAERCYVVGSSLDPSASDRLGRLATAAECRAAVEAGQELLTGPIDLGPRLASSGGQLKLAEMGHLLVMPLRHDDAVRGAIELQFVGDAALSEGAREIVGLAAAMMAPWLAQDRALGALVAVRAPGRPTSGERAEARALSEELAQMKRFLDQLIDASPEAIVACDEAGAVTLFNKAAESLFGLSARQVTGRLPFDLLFPEGVGAKLREQLAGSSGAGGAIEPLRSEVIDAQQLRVPVQLTVSVMPRAAGATGSVAVISDLRERLRIEHDLVHVRERLLVSEKQALLAELAGTTAHELNQPLTSVMGYAELLLRRLPPQDVNHHAAETILEQAQRMADIVRKIGRITRYETKPYVGETQILDLDRSTE